MVAFVVLRSGLSGVSVTGPSVRLDPMATPGEACNGRAAACGRDGKSELTCRSDQTMAVTDTCKGPNGCRATPDGTTLSCDTTYADPKDPCTVKDSSCSTDHRSELRCQGGRYAVVATCKGPDGCTLTPAKGGDEYTLTCDDHIADVGDPCFDATRTACSSDKRSLLACTAQRFAVDRACKKECRVKKMVGTSNVAIDCY
jgi:hypothetical protein